MTKIIINKIIMGRLIPKKSDNNNNRNNMSDNIAKNKEEDKENKVNIVFKILTNDGISKIKSIYKFRIRNNLFLERNIK